MSQAPNDLTFNVKASTDLLSIQSAARQAKEEFEREFGGIHGQLEKMDELFGRSSTFGHVLHAAEGGGALFGIGMLGRELAEGSEKLKDLVEKFDEGKISGGQMVDEIAKGIPLLGNFYAATRNIVDLMSGEAELQRQITESAKAAADFRKQEFEGKQKLHELQKEFAQSTIAANNAAANVYLEGPSRSIASIQQSIDERHRTAKDALHEALKKGNVFEYEKSLAERKDEIARAKQELEKAENALYGAQNDPYVNYEQKQIYVEQNTKTRDAVKKKYDQLVAEETAQKKRHDDALKKITDDFNNDILAKDRAGQQEITKLREDQQKQREATLLAGEKRISDTLAHARSAELTEERQQYEAHLVELQQALADALSDLGRKTREQIQKDLRDTTFSLFPTRAGQVGQDLFMALREAAADYQNFTAQSGASKREFDDQERLKALEREGQLAKANLDVLRAQAEVGDRAAKLEVEKLEAAQKYRDLARELLAIMTNPTMSGDARSEASRQLGLLPLLEMQAIAGIRDHRTLPTSLARLQTVSSAGGAAAAAMTGHDREQMQLSAYHDPQQEVVRAVQDIATKLKNLPTAKAIADALKETLSILGFTGNHDNDGSGSNLFNQ